MRKDDFSQREENTQLLLQAVFDGNKSEFKRLLQRGINKTSPHAGTALLKACKEGHLKMVEALLDAGIPVNYQGYHSQTPLMDASRKNRHKIVDLLLKKGAIVTLKDREDLTAVDYAKDFPGIRRKLEAHAAREYEEQSIKATSQFLARHTKRAEKRHEDPRSPLQDHTR